MKNLLLNHIYGKAAPLAIAIVYGCAADAIAETKTNIPQEIAQNVEFDNIFLNLENKSTVDLSRFANGASALPGTYRTLVYVNGDATMSADVEIRSRRNKTTYPCIGRNLIKLIPFNYEQLPNNFLSDLDHNDACLDLEKKLPEAHVLFDSNEQRMDISIPQMYVLRNARGSVNPELWDSGIPALIL
ncbi:TPA: FimD/PapC N-terminal domain-containing protein, partial [Klebsiella pneumoniae]|nr:FimD/PapC N-terminal domain-containing protein [Klebsiella pneumoniae]HDH0285707.1 FimD/PapC N-terminal domain-containing protein [Klebsiella pneumoniae]HDH0393086.1 FimD/PapC N-terminal domain-containing protein [Klebsiella pneumoniae]HDH0433862.1 FimD/PapC N-terminal domain-containing protein [Klebsiella pneumoniae]HDH0501292.1 FimD/PapC N-terminal domain-containing protein [Klebsiella pneumoniae]